MSHVTTDVNKRISGPTVLAVPALFDTLTLCRDNHIWTEGHMFGFLMACHSFVVSSNNILSCLFSILYLKKIDANGILSAMGDIPYIILSTLFVCDNTDILAVADRAISTLMTAG